MNYTSKNMYNISQKSEASKTLPCCVNERTECISTLIIWYTRPHFSTVGMTLQKPWQG